MKAMDCSFARFESMIFTIFRRIPVSHHRITNILVHGALIFIDYGREATKVFIELQNQIIWWKDFRVVGEVGDICKKNGHVFFLSTWFCCGSRIKQAFKHFLGKIFGEGLKPDLHKDHGFCKVLNFFNWR